jgi:hypothetical protein
MNLSEQTTSQIAAALRRLDSWIEGEEFRGWDPHDALNSSFVKAVAGRNLLLGITALQLFRRCPVNLRPLFAVRKDYNPKAIGLFLSSYAKKFRATHHGECLRKVFFFAEWLLEHATQGYSGPCWGYHFDWPNRNFFAPAGTPTIVNTTFIALSFLEAEPLLSGSLTLGNATEEVVLHRAKGGRRKVDAIGTARGACDFILRDLNVLRPTRQHLCFSYTPRDSRFVHNANTLGAWLLAAVYARTGESTLAESANAACRFTVSRQSTDGSWPYGISEKDQWIDNFHTGFILVALHRIAKLLNTDEFEVSVDRGYEFWKGRMFLPNLVPKYYANRTYPIDIHCVAQAILTLLELSDRDPGAVDQARTLCSWAIQNMQDSDGFFHYQLHRWHRVRIPYMRWGQAWMQLALTEFLHHADASGHLSSGFAVENIHAC